MVPVKSYNDFSRPLVEKRFVWLNRNLFCSGWTHFYNNEVTYERLCVVQLIVAEVSLCMVPVQSHNSSLDQWLWDVVWLHMNDFTSVCEPLHRGAPIVRWLNAGVITAVFSQHCSLTRKVRANRQVRQTWTFWRLWRCRRSSHPAGHITPQLVN